MKNATVQIFLTAVYPVRGDAAKWRRPATENEANSVWHAVLPEETSVQKPRWNRPGGTGRPGRRRCHGTAKDD